MGESPQPASAPLTAGARPRLDSIDALRGLVMVLMCLDHTRDFLSQTPWAATYFPTTTVPLFLTRWITHYCAPTFIFLTGVGAFLSLGRGRSTAQLSWFLFSRGLWIAILELTVVRMEWTGYRLDREIFLHNGGGVLWAIGISMVGLAGLVFLPRWLILAIGLALIVNHNAFDQFDTFWGAMTAPGQWAPVPLASGAGLWRLLHVSGAPWSIGEFSYGGGYPIVPWVGLMAVGFAFGPVVKRPQPERLRWYVALGLALALEFVVLRWTNVYGDLRPWKEQPRGPEFTFLSFLDCHKYPPSLCYLLMTIGPALLLLALFEVVPAASNKVLVVFGRVPMFFYLLHLALIFVTGLLLLKCGWPTPRDVAATDTGIVGLIASPSGGPLLAASAIFPDRALEPYMQLRTLQGLDVPLPQIYLLWLAIVFILYWPCRWYAGVKQRHKSVLLSYL